MSNPGVKSEPLIRGYCPSTYHPMLARDGWLVRVRAPLEGVTAAQGLLLAELALAFCHGALQLTSRGNIQLRVRKRKAIEIIRQEAIQSGLIYPHSAVEKRLNILITPQIMSQCRSHPDTLGCAQSLRNMVIAAPGLEHLSAKFGFAVDGSCDANRHYLLSDVIICYGVRARRWFVQSGDYRSGYVTWQKAVEIAVALARACVALGWDRRPLRCPRKTHLLFDWAGERCSFSPFPFSYWRAYAAQPLGLLGNGHLAVHLPQGLLDPVWLKKISYEPSHARDLRFMVTPWQGLILPAGMHSLERAPFVTKRTDPRLRIFACPGAGLCSQALGETRSFISELAPRLPEGKNLHISGCAKGCAWPHRADYTLVAREDGYGVVRDGKASDHDHQFFTKASAIPAMFSQTEGI